MDAAEDFRFFRLGQLPFLDFAVEVFGNRFESAIQEARLHIAQEDRKTVPGKDVRNAVAHGACAEHGHSFDGVNVHEASAEEKGRRESQRS